MINKKKLCITIDSTIYNDLQRLRAVESINISAYVNNALSVALNDRRAVGSEK